MVKILQSTERNGIAELELVRLWQKEARDINFWRNEAKTIKPFVEELKANTSRTLPKKAPSGKMRQEKAADLIKKNKKAMTSHTSAEGDKKTDNMEEGEILDTAKGRQTFPDITSKSKSEFKFCAHRSLLSCMSGRLADRSKQGEKRKVSWKKRTWTPYKTEENKLKLIIVSTGRVLT